MRQLQITGINAELYPFALVDDEDYDRANQHKWTVDKQGYVSCSSKNESPSLHRFIMNCTLGDGKIIDHKNRKPWDNQKSNLRFVTHRENSLNKDVKGPSGEKSIYFDSEHQVYRISVFDSNYQKCFYLGEIENFEEGRALRKKFLRESKKLKTYEEKKKLAFEYTILTKNLKKTKKNGKLLGVQYETDTGRWYAVKEKYEIDFSLGCYDTEEQAHLAFKNFTIRTYGVKDPIQLQKIAREVKIEHTQIYPGLSFDERSQVWELESCGETQKDVIYVGCFKTKELGIIAWKVIEAITYSKGRSFLTKEIIQKIRKLKKLVKRS